MRRSIVPPGFETSSHRIFHDYLNPMCLPITFSHEECSPSLTDISASESASSDVDEFKGDSAETDVPFCCPICLQSASDPVTLVACHHFFCMECIIKWFQKKLECPLCKVSCAFFIQPSSGKEEQYNLWKTAPSFIGSNGLQGSLNFSSSISVGLRRAMVAHRSNFCNRNAYHIPCDSPAVAATLATSNTESEAVNTELMQSSFITTNSLMVEERVEHTLSTVDTPSAFAAHDYKVHLSNDLTIVSDELRRLEMELESLYGAVDD